MKKNKPVRNCRKTTVSDMNENQITGVVVAFQINEAWGLRRFLRGMTLKEVDKLTTSLNIKPKQFWKQFGVNTCGYDEQTREVLYYRCDIERTLEALILAPMRVKIPPTPKY